MTLTKFYVHNMTDDTKFYINIIDDTNLIQHP
jgi:hypothetical protein